MSRFRPKYTIERYPLVFTFKENIQTVPVIEVNVLSGNDPNKNQILGIQAVYKNFVLVELTGGVAGCIYEIICTVDEEVVSHKVAVISTQADAPPDSNIPLFSALVTTPPYPVFYSDSIDVSFGAIGGALILLVKLGTIVDSLDTDFGPTGGSLFIVPPAIIEDFIDTSFGPIGGTLEEGAFGNFEDALNSTFGPTEGRLFAAPRGTFIDSVDTTFGPTGGTLGVP